MDDRLTKTMDDLVLQSLLLTERISFSFHSNEHCKHVLIFFIQPLKNFLVDIVTLQANSNHVWVSAASCSASDNLLMNTALYLRFRSRPHARLSSKLDLEDLLI